MQKKAVSTGRESFVGVMKVARFSSIQSKRAMSSRCTHLFIKILGMNSRKCTKMTFLNFNAKQNVKTPEDTQDTTAEHDTHDTHDTYIHPHGNGLLLVGFFVWYLRGKIWFSESFCVKKINKQWERSAYIQFNSITLYFEYYRIF